MEYAFDTNTIIHLMRGTQSAREKREKAQRNGNLFCIPPFVNRSTGLSKHTKGDFTGLTQLGVLILFASARIRLNLNHH